MRRRPWRTLVWLALAAWLATAWWQTHKPLVPGTHVASPECTVPAAAVAFLPDVTAADAYGHLSVRQGIFDATLHAIAAAQRFVVLDYERLAAAEGGYRMLAGELTEALVKLRHERAQVRVLLLTDPVNERYGHGRSDELALLRAAGVEVVSVPLGELRDPNFLYSAVTRLTLDWWGGPPGQAGALARRLEFKSAHRKLVIADDGRGGLTAVVGSANPADRESAWSNAALEVSGGPVAVLLRSELALAHGAGWRGDAAAFASPTGCDADSSQAPSADQARVQVLTEGTIRQALLEQVSAAERGDAIDLAAFRLADRGLLDELLEAARRGVHVRLLLDPSEDATTLSTSGLPNQPLASELVARSAGAVHVRWYRTHGERFHAAVARIAGTGRVWLLVGSANFTRRSLMDYNLEADVALGLARDAPLAQASLAWFDQLWGNDAAQGIEYTADFASFADPSQADYWLGRWLEASGLGGF